MSCTLTIIAEPNAATLASDVALQHARAALELAESSARPFEMCRALCELARCYQQTGAVAVTEALLEQALVWGRATGSNDMVVDLLCELSELGVRQADAPSGRIGQTADRTRAYAAEGARLAAHVADPSWEVKVLLRVSDVLDRLGDHGDAVALQTRALEMMSGADPEQAGAPQGLASPLHPTLQ